MFEPLPRIPFVAVGAGDVPARITTAAVPDLVTRALGVESDWSVRADASAPLISQRSRRLALSPDGRFKILQARRDRLRSFDLLEDPGEQNALQPVPEALAGALTDFQERVPVGHIEGTVKVRVDEATVEALRALGYVGDPP
jgi:hypothetical protein